VRFLLVDRITGFDAERAATGWKNVAMSEDYLDWHFPERPVMPGVLVLEACVQLAGWLEARSSEFERWFLVDRVASAKYYGLSVPGDRLDLRVERVDDDEPARRSFHAEARVGEERRAAFEFSGIAVPLASVEDPARMRRALATLEGRPPMGDPRGVRR
jgi:3-hydroxyacyl-[acyl-carrier-protein] dehydratase